MEIADQHHVLVLLWIQASERAVSCQYLPAAQWRLPAVVMPLTSLTVTFVTALLPGFSLLLCLSPTLTSFLTRFLSPSLFPITPFFPFPQPSAAVRSYHSSNAATMSSSLGSSWTSAGQGTRSGSTFTRSSLRHYLSHYQHHAHPTHTSYAYCPAHTAVSTAITLLLPCHSIVSFFLCVCV